MRARRAAFLEVSVFYGLVLVIIWGGGRFRPPVVVIALIMIGLCVFSNFQHGDNLEKIGLARKNFKPAAKLVFRVCWPFVIPLLLAGWGKHPLVGWDMWFSFLGYPVWAFAQEYALLGFVANRLDDIFPANHALVPWINGILFSMAHLPNPVLMFVTFTSGTLFSFLFFKRRHLIPLALVHALFGVLISLAFSNINGIMSVGPGYIARVGEAPGVKAIIHNQ